MWNSTITYPASIIVYFSSLVYTFSSNHLFTSANLYITASAFRHQVIVTMLFTFRFDYYFSCCGGKVGVFLFTTCLLSTYVCLCALFTIVGLRQQFILAHVITRFLCLYKNNCCNEIYKHLNIVCIIIRQFFWILTW